MRKTQCKNFAEYQFENVGKSSLDVFLNCSVHVLSKISTGHGTESAKAPFQHPPTRKAADRLKLCSFMERSRKLDTNGSLKRDTDSIGKFVIVLCGWEFVTELSLGLRADEF